MQWAWSWGEALHGGLPLPWAAGCLHVMLSLPCHNRWLAFLTVLSWFVLANSRITSYDSSAFCLDLDPLHSGHQLSGRLFAGVVTFLPITGLHTGFLDSCVSFQKAPLDECCITHWLRLQMWLAWLGAHHETPVTGLLSLRAGTLQSLETDVS